jgi:Tol biopolymer transport system component
MPRGFVLALPPIVAAALLQGGAPRVGKIVYARQEGMRAALHVMNADGSGDAVLPGQTASMNIMPNWSPDGKRIAFMVGGRQEPVRVVISNADGSGATILDPPARAAGLPAFSPDGKQLAFTSGDAAPSVYLADTAGNGARQLNAAGTGAMFPFWSRDGKAVGYTRMQDERGELVLARVDGSGESVLTQTGKLAVAGANAVSPDGKRLAFLAVDVAARTGSLRMIDLAERVETTITDLKLDYAGEFFLAPAPAWSPDGKGILLPIVAGKGRPLFLISADGKTRTRLTPEEVECLQAAWWAPR